MKENKWRKKVGHKKMRKVNRGIKGQQQIPHQKQ